MTLTPKRSWRANWVRQRSAGVLYITGHELSGGQSASSYYANTFEIGRVLMGGFAQALGERPDYFEPFLRKPPSQLRLIHYPFNPDAQDKPGSGAHTDYECFTLLRATGPGLEVLNESGVWVDVPPI